MLGFWTQRRILMSKWLRHRVYLLPFLALLASVCVVVLVPAFVDTEATSSERFSPAGDLTTYGYSVAHENFNSAETNITATTARHLKQKWVHRTRNSISDQPAVTTIGGNTLVFWGDWNGYLHATNVSNNKTTWAAFLGQTSDASCDPPVAGIASSPTVATINGRVEVIVGGGDANLYALDATTGKILWKTPFPGSSPSVYIWSSSTIYNGSIYIGSASFGDCPLMQGQLLQLDATSGKLIHQFDAVPVGCTGGGMWSTPTIDEAAAVVYIATGNPPKCTGANIYAPAILALDAADISHLLGYWQVPKNQQNGDSDFGTTPTLFQETINGATTHMVGAANKDGIYYAFDRSNLNAGPVWEVRIAVNGECPQCGGGSVSSSAWDGHTLYMAGGRTTINAHICKGSVRALHPNTITLRNASTSASPTPTANITFLWQHCMLAGPVIASVTVAGATAGNEVVAASQGPTVIVMNAVSGKTLARLTDHKHNSLLYAPPTISNGVLFVGNMDGNLYAYSVNGV